MLKNMLLLFIFMKIITFTASAEDLAGKLVIEGTGDSQKLLRALGDAFEEHHPGITIHIPDSIGSSGGIKMVSTGKIEVGRIARELQEKERQAGLKSLLFAKSPVVFVAHPSVKDISGLSADQIVGIYSGKYRDWEAFGEASHKIYPIARESGDSSRTVIEAHIPEFKSLTNSVGKIFYTTPGTIQALEEHAYTFGYVPLSMVKAGRLRVLNFEGAPPSAENVHAGRYPLLVPFALVYKEKENLSLPAQAFMDFLFSDAAGEIIREYSCVPVSGDVEE